jgi:hypothetical protein
MEVEFEKVTPGIALGTADADKLRGEIAAYAEGIPNIKNILNKDVKFDNFKDSDNRTRSVQFQITREQNAKLYVELKTFQRV